MPRADLVRRDEVCLLGLGADRAECGGETGRSGYEAPQLRCGRPTRPSRGDAPRSVSCGEERNARLL